MEDYKMEWEKEEILKELSNHFSKDKDVEEINQEILDSLSIDNPSENRGTVTVDEIDYVIIQDENEATRIAIEQVKNDLEEDPQLFNQTWLQDFTYISECDKDIMVSEEENYIREMVTEDSENEIFENEEDKKKWIDEIVKEKLKEYEEGFEDPINYFVNEQGMFSVADLMTQSWINIDVEKAAEDAVQLDGWPHFLSHYDGEYEETENGLIIFRDC